MKKFITIVSVICVAVLIWFILYPASPWRSAQQKQLLLSDSVLADLQIKDVCKYRESAMTLEGLREGYFECLTSTRLSQDQSKIEIGKMRKIIEAHGWKLSTPETTNDYDVYYRKGQLFLNIQQYSWEPGYTDRDGYPLIVTYMSTR